MSSKLIFVYNAKSGKLNALLDSAHKILSPDTYKCNLCALTFGVFSENKQWKTFRKTAGIDMEFLHLDEFENNYASEPEEVFEFPIVFLETDKELDVFISASELNEFQNTNALIKVISERLKKFIF